MIPTNPSSERHCIESDPISVKDGDCANKENIV